MEVVQGRDIPDLPGACKEEMVTTADGAENADSCRIVAVDFYVFVTPLCPPGRYSYLNVEHFQPREALSLFYIIMDRVMFGSPPNLSLQNASPEYS